MVWFSQSKRLCLKWRIKMVASINPHKLSLSFLQTLKEYEIITLKYNKKTCRLESLRFSVSEDIILFTIRPCIWDTNASKYKLIQICQPVQLADNLKKPNLLKLWRGGENKYLSKDIYKKTDWMPHTGLKCWNANFIHYANHLPGRLGGGGSFFYLIIFFFTIYTYKLLQAFPQKHL